jgi:heavy metal sensor kinase
MLPSQYISHSVRLRLTLWYVLAFGLLLVGFSVYILSSLSHELRREFDTSLLRTAQATADYFMEFAERKNAAGGARETIRELRLGKLGVAIFQGKEFLAASSDEIRSAVSSTKLLSALNGSGDSAFTTNPKTNSRLVAVSFQEDSVSYTVVALESMLGLTEQLARLRRAILFALPAALFLAALGGFAVAGKTLRPVVAISEQTQRITAKNLDERLKVSKPDEFGRLALVINGLLARLDISFRVMREFVADASHELRTPLAIIRGEADVSLSRERTPDEYREALGIILENSKRMSLIVKDMLDLARADGGQKLVRREELYLNDLVKNCCRAAQPLAATKGLQLTCTAEEDISFSGDEELLKRMTFNLVHNAIQYTPSSGAVSVRLTKDNERACLTVCDTGIGIPADSVNRVFDRFYRVAESRTRAEGGSGLGLSIVKLAAESHGGSVGVESEPGSGSKFTVSLPFEKTWR